MLELELLQIALGVRDRFSKIPTVQEWDSIYRFAEQQSLIGLYCEGVENLPREQTPYIDMLMEWVGQGEYIRSQNKRHWKVAQKLSFILSKENIEATILKGVSIAQYYTDPLLRYSCDLDLYIGDGWERACEILEQNGIVLEREVYKEVEFTIDNVYVECHRVVTPVRGNATLQRFERYLHGLLDSEKNYFQGTLLLNPPLMFKAMLWIEHALWDLLHDKMQLRHIVDWVILRRQNINRDEIEARCSYFGFMRFLRLADSLADFLEKKISYQDLPLEYKEVFDSMIAPKKTRTSSHSWFMRRIDVLKEIIRSNKMYKRYGYCSMQSFIFNSLWTHFFDKEIRY